MNSDEIRDRYRHFMVFDKPIPFKDFAKDKDFDVVRVISVEQVEGKDIGFCGIFKWNSNEIKSIDGDIYHETTPIYGYRLFPTSGIDILVLEW